MGLRGFISFGIWLAKELWREYGIPRKLLGDPESFSFSYSKRALTSASIRYWGLAPLLTADPPFSWALS